MGTVSVSGLLVGSSLCIFGGLALLIINGGGGIGIPIVFVGLLSASTAQILQRQSARIELLEQRLAKRDKNTEMDDAS
jgi:hypothetical protein